MSHYFIDKHDPRVADLFRRLEKAGKALDKLESSGGRTLKGERFVTDEELSRLLKISRRTLQEYRAALLLPVARPDAHSAAGTDIFALKAASENLPTASFAMTGQCPSSFISLFLR